MAKDLGEALTLPTPDHNAGVPWICSTGHLVGHIHRLYIANTSIYINQLVTPAGFIIDGHALIPCPECGELVEWSPGAVTLKKLLAHYA